MNWLTSGESPEEGGEGGVATRTPRMWPPSISESFRQALALLRRQTDLGVFLAHIDQCVEQCHATGHHFEAGRIGLNAAVFLNHIRAYGRVSPYCRRARKDFTRATRQPLALHTGGVETVTCFLNLGSCYFEEGVAFKELGTYGRAMHAFQKAGAVFRAHGEDGAATECRLYWAASLRDHGIEKQDQAVVEKAVATLALIRQEFIATGREKGVAQCFLSMSPGLLFLKRPEALISDYPEARRIWEKEGTAFHQRWCREAYAEALRLQGELEPEGK